MILIADAQKVADDFVTIVMPVLNEEKHLRRCLQSVVHQDYPMDKLEILVVDGMSGDGSRRIVTEFAAQYPQIRLLDNPRRIIPAAMNIGIREARGEIILRVDGHCLLAPDYIRQCIRYLRETGADNVGGPAWAMGTSYIGEAIALALGSPFGHGGSPFRYSQEERYVDTVFLGAFRRELFIKVGFYDEELACGEDCELNHRIRAAGGRILLAPAIKVRYMTRDSLRELCRQYFRYGFWRMQVVRKHRRALRLRHLGTVGFVLALIVTGLAGFFGRPFAYLLPGIVLIYLAASLLSSFLIACRSGWKYLPILPPVFACLHLSWGLGFLWGVADVFLLGRRGVSSG